MKLLLKAIIPFLLITIIIGCSNNPGNNLNDTPVKVEVETAKLADASQALAYSGTIEESETIPLTFSAVGTVSKVFVTEGAHVAKGQILATLDSTTFHNTYAMMQASEQQAEDAYNRLTPMHTHGNLSDVKYVEIETDLQKAKSSAAIAKKNLDDCTLYASTDGYIGKRSIEPGMTAMPNLVSITIVKINNVFARISVAENEIAAIKKGQQAGITIEALGTAHYSGVVEEIGVIADQVAHSYKIKIKIENKALSIKPGMICSAIIEIPNASHSLVVPGRAVLVDETGKNFVYVVGAQNKAIRKYIVTGQMLNSGIEVLDGLQMNETVVVEGQHKLIDNALVQIVN